MIRPDILKSWYLAVLVFFAAEVLDPVLTGTAEVIAAIVAVSVYVFVGIYTFAPEREITPERPSAVRSRVEAARRSQQQ